MSAAVVAATAPPLHRILPLLHLHHNHHHRHHVAGIFVPLRRLACSFAAESTRSSDEVVQLLRVPKPPTSHGIEEEKADCSKWREKEKEILREIGPVARLAKEILHSSWYMDGERLHAEHERVVVEKLLAYHPRSEDKIGCGISSIMVDQHPMYKGTRCLFVVRTDGVWIDFSYQKCLRAYIRTKFPAHAEKFIRTHLKRGSGTKVTR